MTMREKIAREIEIAIVEKTMHHPVAKELPKLAWLWPHVADAVLAAMREPTEDMTDDDSYLTGQWSRRNIEAFIDAALAQAGVTRMGGDSEAGSVAKP